MKFAALALVASVTANELHMFAPENWKTIMPIAIRDGGYDVTDDSMLGKGTISFSQCADPLGAFKFDEGASTYSPNPFKKGNTVDITLKGSYSKAVHIDNYEVTAYLNGSKLTTETFDGGDFDSAWSFNVKQKLPLISPSGHYKVHVVANGALKGSQTNGIVGCGDGEFDL